MYFCCAHKNKEIEYYPELLNAQVKLTHLLFTPRWPLNVECGYISG